MSLVLSVFICVYLWPLLFKGVLGMRVQALAASINAIWEGDGEREIQRVASLEDAGPNDLSFVTHGRAAKDAGVSRAACLLVPEDYPNPEKRTLIRVADPRA